MPTSTIEKSQLRLESVVIASPDVVQVELHPGSEKTVVVNIESSRYCLLNKIGTRVWQLIGQPIDAASIVATVLSEYRVDEERCRRDVLAVLDRLCAFGGATVLKL